MKTDYLPKSLGDLDTWEVNFKTKVTTIAEKLAIPAAEVEPVLAKIDEHRNVFAIMVGKRNESKAATSTNNKSQADAQKLIRTLANRIKSASGYTEAMGNELKIIGTDTAIDLATAKPTLSISKDGGNVILRFTKDHSDGVYIYCRRSAETQFTFLAVDTVSPYHDNRPNITAGLAEKREYKASYFLDEQTVGLESDVISISV